MKKSSLGRRSSIQSQGRLSLVDKNTSRVIGDGKKSFIPKPHFASKYSRSSSVERDLSSSCIKKEALPSGLRRSKSYLSIDFGRTSTPCYTPVQFNARNTTSMYRGQMSEGGRSSSVGGLKSAKKDSRPITEKSFQIASQQKIQEFFVTKAPELLDKGSIKPMTTGMFADLVNFLIQPYEQMIVINRNNPMDGVLQLCKLYNYKGKAEKSWLRTVNTPHSWPHVVSFLVWLVELYQASEAFHVVEALYPEADDEELEINDYDFKCLVPHLLRGYNAVHRQKPPGDDSDEMRQFLIKHKKALNLDEADVRRLQQEYSQLQEELNNSNDAIDEENLQRLENESKMLKEDIKKSIEYNYDAECYINNAKEKIQEKDILFAKYEQYVEELDLKRKQLETIISAQEMSPEQQKEIESRVVTLQNEIHQLNDEKVIYQQEKDKVDLELFAVRKIYTKAVQDYNKEITLALATMPELKEVQIENSFTLCMDAPDAIERFIQTDNKLDEIKMHVKSLKNSADMNLEKTKFDLEKAKDNLMSEQDEYDKIQNECIQLENDMEFMKKRANKEREQVKTALADIQKKIKIEKEKLQLEKFSEQKELEILQENYEKEKKEYEEFKEKSTMSMNNRRQNIERTESKLKEIIKESLVERKKITEEIVGSGY